MAKLILVKHSSPEITPEVVSHRWVLSAEGRRRCDWLASELAGQNIARLCSSLEPKALETAALVAMQLGLDVQPRSDLHENDRTGLGFGALDALKLRMRQFFDEPANVVVGTESAAQARQRFEVAIRALISEAPDQTVAVVTHGTVLTTLVAKYNQVAPFDFWESLAVPSIVTLDGNSMRLDRTVHNFPT